MQLHNRLFILAVGLAVALCASAARADALAGIKTRGVIACGVAEGVPGFSAQDSAGNWAGLEADYCRALAAAVFDDPDKVRFSPFDAAAGLAALTGGSIDVLARPTVWGVKNGTQMGIKFVGTLFYDGQGFLVRKASGITSATQLSGRPLCVQSGTAAELNVTDYFSSHNMTYKPIAFGSAAEAVKAYADGQCDILTSNRSSMAAARSSLKDRVDHIILPEIISKEPLGPAVRRGDSDWFGVARWTLFALINAEELGVTQANIDEMLGSDNPQIKRLLGVEEDFGTPLGLTKDWAYRIIKLVGNYGELYDKAVGPKTVVGLDRGLNNLSTQGGILYAAPVR